MIKDARERLRVSQKDLADAVRVSQSVVSLWEKSSSVPGVELLPEIGRVLKQDVDALLAARARTEARNAAPPRTVDYILYQADEFLRDHDATIWVCGPDQLPVLESVDVQRKWVSNMEAGVCYHLLWVLDRVQPAAFKAALPHFAQIADEAGKLREEKRKNEGDAAAGHWGRICFHAVVADDDDAETIGTYKGFCENIATEDEPDGLLTLMPLVTSKADPSEGEEVGKLRAQLKKAIEQLLLIWHPETSVILYQPKSMKTPPIANIRLMEVSEEIYSLGGQLKRPMYWLSPLGAAHFSHVLETIAAALEGLTPLAAPTEGGSQ